MFRIMLSVETTTIWYDPICVPPSCAGETSGVGRREGAIEVERGRWC